MVPLATRSADFTRSLKLLGYTHGYCTLWVLANCVVTEAKAMHPTSTKGVRITNTWTLERTSGSYLFPLGDNLTYQDSIAGAQAKMVLGVTVA